MRETVLVRHTVRTRKPCSARPDDGNACTVWIPSIRSRQYPIITPTPTAVVCRVYLSLSQYVHYTRRPRGRANDKYNVSLTVKSFETTEVKKTFNTHTERDPIPSVSHYFPHRCQRQIVVPCQAQTARARIVAHD